MNRRAKWERLKSQPEWFQKYLQGIHEKQHYSLICEGLKYAVVKCDGHSWYNNAWVGLTYAPTEYSVIKRTTDSWHNLGITVARGRPSKKLRTHLLVVLAAVENGADPRQFEVKRT